MEAEMHTNELLNDEELRSSERRARQLALATLTTFKSDMRSLSVRLTAEPVSPRATVSYYLCAISLTMVSGRKYRVESRNSDDVLAVYDCLDRILLLIRRTASNDCPAQENAVREDRRT